VAKKRSFGGNVFKSNEDRNFWLIWRCKGEVFKPKHAVTTAGTGNVGPHKMDGIMKEENNPKPPTRQLNL